MSLVGLLYLPASQVVQILTPPTDTDPAAHVSQVLVVDDAYMPAVQYVHDEDPAVATFPLAQSVHAAMVVPPALILPAAQTAHDLSTVVVQATV